MPARRSANRASPRRSPVPGKTRKYRRCLKPMHVLKVFCWKTPQACLRFRQLQPADGKTPASKGKG
ncbi:hypothetical protein, partial [Achromobacter xylosoxidans]|uniref:hypothetical protein n=1 Tax=Alcaligenes xylosoxydans xylosoxydans TaxID=85698 RepID=UPI001E6019D3